MDGVNAGRVAYPAGIVGWVLAVAFVDGMVAAAVVEAD